MNADTSKTERVRVELSVQKGLLGFPISPAQYYVGVVGTGPQLGNENPDIAPRCKRIGNNIWVKEIWVPKESYVTFKFLVVHAPTNRIVQSEEIPYHRIRVNHFPVSVETMFNQVKIKGGRGFCMKEPLTKQENNHRDVVQASQEVRQEAEVRKEAEKDRVPNEISTIKEKAKQTERVNDIEAQLKEKENCQQRHGAGDVKSPELTKPEESKRSERQPGSEHGYSTGTDIVKRDKKICRADMQKVLNEIRKDFKVEKVLAKKGDMLKIQMRVNQSVLERFGLRPKDMDRIARGIGLQPIQSQPGTDDCFRQQLWLPKDKAEEFVQRKTTETYKLTSDKETQQVKINEMKFNPLLRNGARLQRTMTTRSSHTISTYKRGKSLRPIIPGNMERTPIRALTPTADRYFITLQNLGPKHIEDSGTNEQTKESNSAAKNGSEITRETNTCTDKATVSHSTGTAVTDLNIACDVKDTKTKEVHVQPEESSDSSRIPFYQKGLALVATVLAMAAGLKYFVS